MELVIFYIFGFIFICWLFYKLGQLLEPITGISAGATFGYFFLPAGIIMGIIRSLFHYIFGFEYELSTIIGFSFAIGLFILIHYLAYKEKKDAEHLKAFSSLRKKQHYSPSATAKPTRSRKEYSGSDVRKESEVFKTTSVKETLSKDIQQKKAKPTDLTSIGFKVVRKARDE